MVSFICYDSVLLGQWKKHGNKVMYVSSSVSLTRNMDPKVFVRVKNILKYSTSLLVTVLLSRSLFQGPINFPCDFQWHVNSKVQIKPRATVLFNAAINNNLLQLWQMRVRRTNVSCLFASFMFHWQFLNNQKIKLDADLANRYHWYVFSVITASRLESKHLMFSKYCHFLFAPIYIKKSLTFLSSNAARTQS